MIARSIIAQPRVLIELNTVIYIGYRKECEATIGSYYNPISHFLKIQNYNCIVNKTKKFQDRCLYNLPTYFSDFYKYDQII